MDYGNNGNKVNLTILLLAAYQSSDQLWLSLETLESN